MQALAKGDRDDQAIEAATEFGVDEVVPWQASRSIVQWRGERAEKARRKWESTVAAAAKQSRRARVPVVAELATTKTLADPHRRRRGGIRAARGRDAEPGRADASRPTATSCVVVGPEGGITPEEVAGVRGGRRR